MNCNMSERLLVIDDEESLCEILKFNLERAGYQVDTAYSAEEALEMDLSVYNLALVDIMMERLSGFDFAKRVRQTPRIENLPIIFCTALTGEDDTVMGLNLGADDYITKPFVISEVLARVRAVLRRSKLSKAPTLPTDDAQEEDLEFGGLKIDNKSKRVLLDGTPVSLTKTEFGLLSFFLTHPNRVYSREEIIRQVWSGDVVVTTRTIDTNITRLRKKIGDYGRCIVTRLGFGYGFKENVD